MTIDATHCEIHDEIDLLSPDVLRARRTAKWGTQEADVLAAPVAEMDFALAPVLRAALVGAIERGETGYPLYDGALESATVAVLQRKSGLRVHVDQIKILPDVLKGIDLAIKCFSPPGSPVVVLTPSYPPFFRVPGGAGRSIVEVPLLVAEERYTFDFEAIDRALSGEARTLILCNPYNPVGRVFTRQELERLADVVEMNGARIISDEVHAPLTYADETFTAYATVSEAAARHSVTLTSASKGWNVAGLKCAQIALTNPGDGEIWAQLPFLETHGASILGILANRVAYAHGDEWLGEVIAYLDGNRRLLAKLIEHHLPGVRYNPPQATYLAWLDCRALKLEDPAGFFLKHARVAVGDGANFGASGAGFVRLNFATSRAILTEIVQRMGRALAAI